MISYNYFDQIGEELKSFFVQIKHLFEENYNNPVMWILILIITVSIVMLTFNSLNKH